MRDNEQEQLEERLAEWELARQEGRDVPIAELCADAPELAAALAAQIQVLKATSWMMVDAAEQVEAGTEGPRVQDTRPVTLDVTIPQFVESIAESGILSDEKLAVVRQIAATDSAGHARRLAERLVREGVLTDYQRNVLLQRGNGPLLLDRYIILDTVGSGGMGLVFKALHRSMERIVALKVLPQYAVDSPEKIARFQREIKATARLSHPNIVAAYDAHEHHGTHFLVMEYVDGENLLEHVDRHGPMMVEHAAQVILDVTSGLMEAHALDIVHRDIKPTNIMLTSRGTAKLLDLGLARTKQRVNETTSQGLTRDGLAMGTVAYMSPEQALDAKDADARSDIYSLGCTLYFLLTGRTLFDKRTSVQSIIAHREEPAPSLHASRKDIPEALERVYRRSVAKDPADRPPSVEALRAELLACQIGHDAPPRGGRATDRPPAHRIKLASDRRRHTRRHRNFVFGVAGLLVALISAWLVWSAIQPSDVDYAAHRDTARWVLSNFGQVLAETEFGEQNLFDASEIPEGKFRIIGLEIYGDGGRAPLENITGIHGLRKLTLAGFDVLNLASLTGVDALKEISLTESQVSPADYAALKQIPQLEQLDLSYTTFADRQIELILPLTNLKGIQLDDTEITGAGVRRLGSLRNLTLLSLSRTDIGDRDLEQMPSQIEHLALAWCSITDVAVPSLLNQLRLEYLDLQGTDVSDAGLSQLAAHPNLRALDVADTKISIKGIQALQGLSSLQELHLNGLDISDDMIQHIKRLPVLNYLDVGGTNLDDAKLLKLIEMSSLEMIDVSESNVTPDGVDQFYEARPDVDIYVDEDQA